MRRALITLLVPFALLVSTLPRAGSARAAGGAAPRPARPETRSRSFFVALLRTDGVLVPFAAYRRGLWLTPWPQPQGFPPGVNSISDLPSPWFTKFEPQTPLWYAREPGAGRAMTLRASKLLEVDCHCATNWGLQTEYRDPKADADWHANAGIALSEPAEIAAPLRLDPRSVEGGRLLPLIRRRFERDERSWLARPEIAARARSVLRASERARRPPAVSSLYRIAAGDGRTLYSFEAQRRYAKPRGDHDPGCENLSALSGVLLREGGRLRFIAGQFALSDCDAKELTYSLPLGLIREGGREFLILQEQGYEDESYTIFELLRGGALRRLRRVEGGAC